MSSWIYDAIALLGLAMIGIGVAQWSAAAALVVVGTVLFFAAVISARRATAPKPK